MKTQIPKELTSSVPQTTWGKILAATPVIMTVIATLLAGLATSEMTKAQYDRAFGAQLQSKAGDQWSYFQAKKMRSALNRNSYDLLQATADVQPIANSDLESVPSVTSAAIEPQLQSALDAIEQQKPDAAVAEILAQIDDKTLDSALQSAREQAREFDAALSPANKAFDKLEKLVEGGDKTAQRDLTAAKMRFAAMRYDAEAKLNQRIANLLELQVRKMNLSAERHHRRSAKFFYGMLAAQAAVIVSTLAMAARQRNLLWTLAAAAGLAAILFGVYVYLRG